MSISEMKHAQMEILEKSKPLKAIEDEESGTRTMKSDGAKGWFLILVFSFLGERK